MERGCLKRENNPGRARFGVRQSVLEVLSALTARGWGFRREPVLGRETSIRVPVAGARFAEQPPAKRVGILRLGNSERRRRRRNTQGCNS